MAIIKLWRDNEKERWWVSEPVDEIMTHVVLFFFKSSEREREIERERETLNVSHGIPRLWGRVYITTETYTHALSHTHKKDTHRVFLIWNRKNKKNKRRNKMLSGNENVCSKMSCEKIGRIPPTLFSFGEIFWNTNLAPLYVHTRILYNTPPRRECSLMCPLHIIIQRKNVPAKGCLTWQRDYVFSFSSFSLWCWCVVVVVIRKALFDRNLSIQVR